MGASALPHPSIPPHRTRSRTEAHVVALVVKGLGFALDDVPLGVHGSVFFETLEDGFVLCSFVEAFFGGFDVYYLLSFLGYGRLAWC